MSRDLNKSQWIQTYSGKMFHILDPRPEDFDLHDIARGLAMQCRFNGQLSAFYSVAQHSVLVMQCVRDKYGIAEAVTLRGALLHDAVEAYLGDLIRPLKLEDGFYREVERRNEIVLAERYGLRVPWSPVIKKADHALLLAERNSFMAEPPRSWTEREPPWPTHPIGPWSPQAAEKEFLFAIADLGIV